MNRLYLRSLLRYGRNNDGPWNDWGEQDERVPDDDDTPLLAAAPQMLAEIEGTLAIRELWLPSDDCDEEEARALNTMHSRLQAAVAMAKAGQDHSNKS